MKILLGILFILAIVATAAYAEGPCVIPGRGHFNILTGVGGLFGAFAHDHLIEAQKIEGCTVIDSKDLTRSSIKLIFMTEGVRVLDPKESAKDRAKVQQTMETDVLRISQYPQVIFESTGIEQGSTAEALRVRGNLTIRGNRQPITL